MFFWPARLLTLPATVSAMSAQNARADRRKGATQIPSLTQSISASLRFLGFFPKTFELDSVKCPIVFARRLNVCSLVAVVFLFAAALRENVTADWRKHQAGYKRVLLAKPRGYCAGVDRAKTCTAISRC